MFTSSKLSPGTIYTRAQLAEMFELPVTRGGNLRNWIFRPDKKRFTSYWLFVTSQKVRDMPQVVDTLDGDILHTEGQAKKMTDPWVKNHKADGIELLVFSAIRRPNILMADFGTKENLST